MEFRSRFFWTAAGAQARRWVLCALLIIVLALSQVAVGFAQTATPIPPTATMVKLQVPINPLMSSTNDWMSTFAPIAAIGIGMTISLAVFAYLAKTIKSAFS
jgi:hypothetical protein